MNSVILNVSYAEKNEAKALGARWNAGLRKWYVPGGTELAPFARWLPEGTVAAAQTPATLAENTGPYEVAGITGVPLSQLMGRVRALVQHSFAQGVWTLVEVSGVQARNGHVYLELAERDGTGAVLAQARGMIWAARAAQLLPEFSRATGIEVAAGIKLLVRARPAFHERFGMSLEIDAIDTDYSLGDLEARKKQIRLRLQQEGIFDANRQLPPPWDFNHVLVLSPENAAGLGDFRAEAQRLEQYGLCRFTYVHSRFQGEGAGGELARALLSGLQACRQAGQQPDALVIIRGGGAVNDLAWLNDYELARAICMLDIPVLTGIGHERDSTLPDEVAQARYDTPSKVIVAIEQRIVQRAREARDAFEQARSLATRALQHRRLQLEQQHTLVQQGARRVLADARQHSGQWFGDLRLSALGQVQQARRNSQQFMEQARAQAQQQLNVAHGQVPMLLAQVRSRAESMLSAARSGSQLQLQAIVGQSRSELAHGRQQVQEQLSTVQHEAARQVQAARSQSRTSLDSLLQLGRQHSRECAAGIRQDLGSISHEARRSLGEARRQSAALFREIAGQGPDKTLGRGFALIRNQQGRPVSSATAVQPGQRLEIEFKDGRLDAQVVAIKGEPQHD